MYVDSHVRIPVVESSPLKPQFAGDEYYFIETGSA